VFISSFSISRVSAYSFHALIRSASVNLLLPLTASSFSVVLVTSSSFFAKEANETPIPDNSLLFILGIDAGGFGLDVGGFELDVGGSGSAVCFLMLFSMG